MFEVWSLFAFLIYLQFIEWLMYGEVTSRNHQAYVSYWRHVVGKFCTHSPGNWRVEFLNMSSYEVSP